MLLLDTRVAKAVLFAGETWARDSVFLDLVRIETTLRGRPPGTKIAREASVSSHASVIPQLTFVCRQERAGRTATKETKGGDRVKGLEGTARIGMANLVVLREAALATEIAFDKIVHIEIVKKKRHGY
jgi:hypothetical protein